MSGRDRGAGPPDDTDHADLIARAQDLRRSQGQNLFHLGNVHSNRPSGKSAP